MTECDEFTDFIVNLIVKILNGKPPVVDVAVHRGYGFGYVTFGMAARRTSGDGWSVVVGNGIVSFRKPDRVIMEFELSNPDCLELIGRYLDGALT